MTVADRLLLSLSVAGIVLSLSCIFSIHIHNNSNASPIFFKKLSPGALHNLLKVTHLEKKGPRIWIQLCQEVFPSWPEMLLIANEMQIKFRVHVLFRCMLLLSYIHSTSVRWHVPQRRGVLLASTCRNVRAMRAQELPCSSRNNGHQNWFPFL